MKNIAVFASGSGSNTEALIKHFQRSAIARVRLVLTNRKNAGVIERANRLGIPVESTSRDKMATGETLQVMRAADIDVIVLAGFLLKIPVDLIDAFPEAIINIHPALLPKFGGQGMYGHHVHEAVLKSGETQSGISIHLVNAQYDKGRILEQVTCSVHATDTVKDLQQRIHALEHIHYPVAVEKYLTA